MRRFAIVVVALLFLMALPTRAPMVELKAMAGAMAGAETRSTELGCSTVACPPMPMPMSGACLALCGFVVAMLSVIAVARQSAGSSRLGVSPAVLVDRLLVSSVFRPPRLV